MNYQGQVLSCTFTERLTVIRCYRCQILFAMPADFDRLCQAKGQNQSFYCPLGHSQVYTESTETSLSRQLEQERAVTERVRMERDVLERSRSAIKGQVTKIKNRVANGICPCCNRTFANLALHMQSQHPDFAPHSEGMPSSFPPSEEN